MQRIHSVSRMAIDETAPLLFETSWEVCNQVGGIYTVLKSKAPCALERWGDNYCLLGPYQGEGAAIEFEESAPPHFLKPALAELEQSGSKMHFGHWLVQGKPQVMLFELGPHFYRLDEYKYLFWRDHGIATSAGDAEVNNALALGFAVAQFFTALVKYSGDRPLLAHFHEWQAGVAIPRIKLFRLPVGVVFTTHATLLGRYMASDNPRFYEEMPYFNPFLTAKHYNIEPRFFIERAATHGADFFTTVSEVTARESEFFLGRKAEYILPNGLNVQRFTALHEFQNLHLRYKERIHEFVIGHFFPSYTFDLDRTLYFFTSGRYEYRNKGMDLFIEGIVRLNQRLKATSNPPTIIAFIITKSAIGSINLGALQQHSMFEDIRNICQELEAGTSKKVLNAVSMGRFPTFEDLLPYEYQVRLKRAMHAFHVHHLPPIVTHNLVNDAQDAVLCHLRARGMFNTPNDPVKVVFHPQFLSATSPLLNLDYEQFVRGCHMGIFPSYYEPWGYTPQECLALGIPTVTSDLSGFGNFAQRNIPRIEENGIHVVKRAHKSMDESANELTEYLLRFTLLSRRDRIELRNRAERLSECFDWDELISYYHAVHDALLNRMRGPGRAGDDYQRAA